MTPTKKTIAKDSPFALKTDSFLPIDKYRHFYKVGDKKPVNVICVTDSRGYQHPDNKSLIELRVDSSNGTIPLWEKGVTLNWRFNKSFGDFFEDGEAAKKGVRKLFGEVVDAWKDACPIKFHEDNDAWDFEVAMHRKDCDATGCVLASAFFPSTGRDTFYIYPTMFEQTHEEQKETIEHEMGHIFGLRHFFANVKEKDAKSELFGSKSSFTIMNYGAKSKLTSTDRKDLKRLYELVWSGELTEINGTKIKQFVSFHMKK